MARARERLTTISAPPRRSGGNGGFSGGGETKQDVLNDICDILEMRRMTVSLGSSLPSTVFAEAARQAGVASGSMPEVCERIVHRAGHRWSPAYDSRGSMSGGGSTVTLEGIQAMREALRPLLAH